MADRGDSSGLLKVCRSVPSQTKHSHSVMQVSRTTAGAEFPKDNGESDGYKRREPLIRRPSYRKLLDDLTGDFRGYNNGKNERNSSDDHLTQDSNDNSDDAANAVDQRFQFVSRDVGSDSGIRALRVDTNVLSSRATTVVQYTQGPDGGQYFIPVEQLSPSDVASFPSGVVMASGGVGFNSVEQVMEEAARKRELRLLKNKEAAKECRRKKKEYVRCLENRVAVLENQNKTLIDELKSLKELYCQKEVHG